MPDDQNISASLNPNETLKISLPTLAICASFLSVNVVAGSVFNVCVVWTIWKTKSLRLSSINLAVLSLCFAGYIVLSNYTYMKKTSEANPIGP